MSIICTWREYVTGNGQRRWDLVVRRNRLEYIAARVWNNGAWHTFDENGMGGENDSEKDVRTAKAMAAASAIEQGFI